MTANQKSEIRHRKLKAETGQGTVEMVVLIPLFTVLGAATVFVAYMCWQGIKVQSAANIGARIAGQEMAGGAKDYATLLQNNGLETSLGVQAAGDPDPTTLCNEADFKAQQDCLAKQYESNWSSGGSLGSKLGAAGGGTGVYWKYRKVIYDQFTPGEQKNLFVPAPQTRGGETEVKVIRVMHPPKVFTWQPPIVIVKATAYGGEDSYMFSLPQFGATDNTGVPFWITLLNKIKQKNPNIANGNATGG